MLVASAAQERNSVGAVVACRIAQRTLMSPGCAKKSFQRSQRQPTKRRQRPKTQKDSHVQQWTFPPVRQFADVCQSSLSHTGRVPHHSAGAWPSHRNHFMGSILRIQAPVDTRLPALPQAPDLGGRSVRARWNPVHLAFLGDAVWTVWLTLSQQTAL